MLLPVFFIHPENHLDSFFLIFWEHFYVILQVFEQC